MTVFLALRYARVATKYMVIRPDTNPPNPAPNKTRIKNDAIG
jgi:hypothetical protein